MSKRAVLGKVATEAYQEYLDYLEANAKDLEKLGPVTVIAPEVKKPTEKEVKEAEDKDADDKEEAKTPAEKK